MCNTNSPQVSYELIGLVFGISKNRVRQIEQRALRKLRVGLLKKGVKTSDVLDLRGALVP